MKLLTKLMIAGGAISTPGTPAFNITLDNLVGLTGGGTTNVFMTGSSGGGGVVVAKSSASRLTGVAPLYVNFDATATTSTASTNPSHELFFAHDFGDTGAGTWANGVQSSGLTSKNAGYGPVTGHVYETPGTYTYTMAVTDGVNTATRTKTIVVQDPNVVYNPTYGAGYETICISHSGNFTGAPGVYTPVNTLGDTDMATAYNAIPNKSNKRILFCKADNWTSSGPISMTNISGLYLGGYGTGVAPSFGAGSMVSVTPSAFGNSMFRTTHGCSDLRICNFKIASNSSVNAVGLNDSITQVLIYKVEIRGASSGFDAYPGGGGSNNTFDQHCMYECLADDLDMSAAGGGFNVFCGFTRGDLMGSYFDNCNRGEGVVRIPFIDRGHLNNNYIARPAYGKNIFKIHSFVYRQMPLRSEKFVVSGNITSLRGGLSYNEPRPDTGVVTLEVGTPSITIGNGGALGDERVRDCIVENNLLLACLGTPKTEHSFINAVCPNVTIRNNIADLSVGDRSSAFTSPYPYTMQSFASIGSSTNDRTVGIRIYNNTLYSNLFNPEQAYFVRIGGIGTAPTVSYVAGTPGVFTRGGADHKFGAGFRVRLGGIPPAPLVAGTDYWVTSTGLTARDFTLAATEGGAPLAITTSGTCTVTQFEQVKDIDIRNNLFYLPHHNPANSTAVAYGLVGDPVAAPENVTSSNNTGNVGAYNISPNFTATPPVALTDWKPTTGSYAINGGTSVPVIRDFNNASRVGAGNHMGAILP